jgi:hypothetical protein
MLYSATTLAKSFYSAISADLGSNKPNILTDEAALQKYTSNYSTIDFNLVSAGPAYDSYDALKPVLGKPQITPSTIFTTYLCQTPERKLTTALVISVLLADLVLLRALWSIMTLVAVYFVKARDAKGENCFAIIRLRDIEVLTVDIANHCMRCAESESVPLLDRDSLLSKNVTVSHQLLRDQDSAY